jgi:hypothetical protein
LVTFSTSFAWLQAVAAKSKNEMGSISNFCLIIWFDFVLFVRRKYFKTSSFYSGLTSLLGTGYWNHEDTKALSGTKNGFDKF